MKSSARINGKPGNGSTDIEKLLEALPACTLCPRLVAGRTQVVGPDLSGFAGRSFPTIAFIGEAPGSEEDELGSPFVGPAGRLLRRLIATHITFPWMIWNLVQCRPVVNGTNGKPTDQEARTCRDTWLLPLLRALQPSVLVTLGAYPYAYLSGRPLSQVKISEVAGRPIRFRLNGKVGLWVPQLHPAAILRNPTQGVFYEQAFKRLNEQITVWIGRGKDGRV